MALRYQIGDDLSSQEDKQSVAELCAATLFVDGGTGEVVRQAVARENGVFAGQMERYSPPCEGDYQIVQRLQRAEISVCLIDFDNDRQAAVAAANAIQQALHGRGTLIALS